MKKKNVHDREDILNAAKITNEEEKGNTLQFASTVTEDAIVNESKEEHLQSGRDI